MIPERNTVLEEFKYFSSHLNAIVLTPHGRSGSVFLQSLLDSHRNILAFPTINFPYELPNRINKPNQFISEFIARFPDLLSANYGFFKNLFNGNSTGFGPDNKSIPELDPQIFINNFNYYFTLIWNETDAISRKDFVVLMHFVLAMQINSTTHNCKYILLHIHNYGPSWENAVEDFPNLYFFASIRDPRESWLSWRNMQTSINKSLTNGRIPNRVKIKCIRFHHIENNIIHYNNLIKYSFHLKPNHLWLVDLNQLHLRNTFAMHKLMQILNLENDEKILQSTILNILWWGNSSRGVLQNGFSEKQVPLRWKNELSNEDIHYVSRRLEKYIKLFEYESGDEWGQKKVKVPLIAGIEFHLFCRLRMRFRNSITAVAFHNALLKRLPLNISKLLSIIYGSVEIIIGAFTGSKEKVVDHSTLNKINNIRIL